MQRAVLSYLVLLTTLAALCTVSYAHSTPDAMVIVPPGLGGGGGRGGGSGVGSSGLGVGLGTTSYSKRDSGTEKWHGLLRREIQRMVRRVETEDTEDTGARNETAIEELDLQAWAKETTAKCISRLSSISKASNPSGIVVCYNLPFLSTDSGVFAADLRLYQVSAAEGNWSSVGGNIDVSLMYNGAAVQLRNETTEEAAATESASASTTGPEKVQEFHFIGQIDKLLLEDEKTDAQLQTLLTPNITLFAKMSDGTELQTTLSTDDATFVNGVFSNLVANETTNTTTTASAAATPFKLPGTRIEIVPIGLYFYGSYMALACIIFGYGTFERQRFRDQYRKRIAQQGTLGGNRAI
ncbi:uncharacterized protein LAJ45_00249 [Morchella importuna]|uniref:uncharacterized protein n=1 Tax=Morchella importuna TaxID=1174673 RepID=UPI001E8CCDC3|nr:uncharacterized protein LAJ45_00249 [Morchella importuna]KAH8155240.1 hypothetical protein LAJ45_00249 [Morchella importuna]